MNVQNFKESSCTVINLVWDNRIVFPQVINAELPGFYPALRFNKWDYGPENMIWSGY